MKTTKRYNGLIRIAGFSLAIFFIAATINAQKIFVNTSKYDEMTSLKRLVLGVSDRYKTNQGSTKVLKNLDFEAYVAREVLLKKWMMTKENWLQEKGNSDEKAPLENWMYNKERWMIIDSDLGITDKIEEDPAIELAEWMYAEEFLSNNVDHEHTSQLKKWMIDCSYWALNE